MALHNTFRVAKTIKITTFEWNQNRIKTKHCWQNVIASFIRNVKIDILRSLNFVVRKCLKDCEDCTNFTFCINYSYMKHKLQLTNVQKTIILCKIDFRTFKVFLPTDRKTKLLFNLFFQFLQNTTKVHLFLTFCNPLDYIRWNIERKSLIPII